MTAYYNEIDPYAAQWIRNLIAAGHIAPGEVDERSIEDVRPDDLRGFIQCHFFAGIGVWSYALRRAGWPDDRPVWSGSCPCQPFSAAGQGAGFADERHLWPAFYHLIQKNTEWCRVRERPVPIIFGEQVASKDADAWIDLVQTDLEALGYAFGAVPFPSAGVGAPHIRDRLYWLADSESDRYKRAGEFRESSGGHGIAHGGPIGRMDDADNTGLEGFRGGHKTEGWGPGQVRPVAPASESCRVGNTGSIGRQQLPNGARGDGTRMAQGGWEQIESCKNERRTDTTPESGPVNGRWSDADWLFCRDGKWRPVEPGTFPLAHGASSIVGRLRAYGNAINAEAARVFIQAVMEAA